GAGRSSSGWGASRAKSLPFARLSFYEMPHLVEVAFKGNRKEFYAWSADDPPAVGAAVIVEGDRGEDLGRVHATGALAAKRYAGVAHGALALVANGESLGGPAAGPVGEAAPAKRMLRPAGADDVARAAELATLDDEARRTAIARVRAHNLAMKLTDAEWQWDRRKLTLYFTAEKRVDFRALVRDLAAVFRARIELKQIGVRDEAKRLTGVGRCGREYCSATWLPELRPVNLNVAKDQRLSLNPTQISGACGRLMCSLRYEHEFYVQQRKRFPKEGRVLATARGEEKVIATDIFRERVTLRALDGETRIVPLDELRREVAAAATAGTPDEFGQGATTVVGVDITTAEIAIPEIAIPEIATAEVATAEIATAETALAEIATAAVPIAPESRDDEPIAVVDGETPDETAARRRGRRGGRRGRPNGGRAGGPTGGA
ncbi:MAG TPA: regulatory iron-sulfur-containing complex subunit RicT, partial [Gemmatirosa sp.]